LLWFPIAQPLMAGQAVWIGCSRRLNGVRDSTRQIEALTDAGGTT